MTPRGLALRLSVSSGTFRCPGLAWKRPPLGVPSRSKRPVSRPAPSCCAINLHPSLQLLSLFLQSDHVFLYLLLPPTVPSDHAFPFYHSFLSNHAFPSDHAFTLHHAFTSHHALATHHALASHHAFTSHHAFPSLNAFSSSPCILRACLPPVCSCSSGRVCGHVHCL